MAEARHTSLGKLRHADQRLGSLGGVLTGTAQAQERADRLLGGEPRLAGNLDRRILQDIEVLAGLTGDRSEGHEARLQVGDGRHGLTCRREAQELADQGLHLAARRHGRAAHLLDCDSDLLGLGGRVAKGRVELLDLGSSGLGRLACRPEAAGHAISLFLEGVSGLARNAHGCAHAVYRFCKLVGRLDGVLRIQNDLQAHI